MPVVAAGISRKSPASDQKGGSPFLPGISEIGHYKAVPYNQAVVHSSIDE